jgi:hypothetical protein
MRRIDLSQNQKLAESLTSPAKVPTRDASLKLPTKPASHNLDLI